MRESWNLLQCGSSRARDGKGAMSGVVVVVVYGEGVVCMEEVLVERGQ